MKFLIQHNLMNEEQLLKVKDAVAPFPHEFIGLIPFSREITSQEPLIGEDYIPYGSTLLTSLGLNYKWKGLHFNLENFSMKKAYENRSDLLNQDKVMTVFEAEQYLRGEKGDVFIRPDLDLKHFSGQVIDCIECANWLKDAMSLPPESGSYAMDPSMNVIIAEPVNIDAEWRYFIVDGKIVSGSMYRRGKQLYKKRELDQEVLAEAQTFADSWLPAQCCVMDLALANDEVKVIEFNCINASGMYDNDTSLIFSKLWEYHTS